tara:strand:- start:3753 stop:4481 length:729 start_codon:yes stop_codon:yes gene_type:complete
MILITLSKLLQYISLLTPFILVIIFILYSFLDGDILSGLPFLRSTLYFFGIFITTCIVIIVQKITMEKQSDNAYPLCNMLPFPFKYEIKQNNEKTSILITPYLNSTILGYTFGYIFLQAIISKRVINYSTLILFILLLLVNTATTLINMCCSINSILLGLILGILFGVFYSFVIEEINNDLLIYNSKVTNKSLCKINSSNVYECANNFKFEEEKEEQPIQEENSSATTQSIVDNLKLKGAIL